MLVFVASFAVGLGPVFWLMISEIYPLRVRGPAMSASTVANWAANFLVAFTFLTLVDTISRSGTFFLYAAIGVLAVLFFAAKVPETKNRSLEEIQHQLGADRDADHPAEDYPAEPGTGRPPSDDRSGRALPARPDR